MWRHLKPPTLLCTTDYATNTGFAWTYIEGVYARVADALATRGIRTLVAYPRIVDAPETLAGSAAEAVEWDTSMKGPRGIFELARRVRAENVRVFYGADRPVWHPGYLALHAAGCGRVIVHAHVPGNANAPTGLRRLAKWSLVRLPLVSSDLVLAVSDFVARRQIAAGQMPPDRVVRIYNGVRTAAERPSRPASSTATQPFPEVRPIIGCSCRCSPEKGVAHLLRAFERLMQGWSGDRPRPVLLYIGDGPAMGDVRALREASLWKNDIRLAGYHANPASLLADADICVVPSLCQEGFGLAAAEPMALGISVIASRVGALPELIEDGVTGRLVPPGDEEALARVLRELLEAPEMRRRLGAAAREHVARELSIERTLSQLVPLLESPFREQAGAETTTALS